MRPTARPLMALSIPVIAALVACAPAPPGSSPGSEVAFAVDELLEIRHPWMEAWSPDGSRIAWVWERAGVENVWMLDATGGAPQQLTAYSSPMVGGVWIEDGPIEALFWSADRESIYYLYGGDLWQVPAEAGASPTAVWETPEHEVSPRLSPDGTRVAFSRDGDLWTWDLQDGTERRLTDSGLAESGPIWSPGGDRIAFTAIGVTPREKTLPSVGPKVEFAWVDRTFPDTGVVSASGGGVRWMARTEGTESAPAWIDERRLVLQRVSADQTTREVVVADSDGGATTVLHRDTDDKWWSLTYLGSNPQPSPDGRWIAFLADRDGWDHLYLVAPDGGEPAQVTSGEHEIRRLAWSPDGTRLAFDSNEGDNPGSRHLMVAEVGNDPAAIAPRELTAPGGVDTEPIWSPGGETVLFQRTSPEHPADLFTVPASGGERRRLTVSLPESLRDAPFVAPRFVRYPAADGGEVPAYLFEPPGREPSEVVPAIVWVHGDGVTQNFDGWHVRRDYAVYYSIHQYFLQQGYAVLAVDYRGSIGYGKEWRQGHFRDLGGADYRDVASGVDYLTELGWVDSERVGVWGLSYGGFMTLQALTESPELWACGIDVAGVVDWRDWYEDPDGPWIKGRMGDPEDSPELYERTAPIERVERIVRPLMVLHGTADVNVPFIESMRLVHRLVEAEKDFDFEVYPGEFHYLQRGPVLADAWHKVDAFFRSCLRDSS